MAKTEQQKKQVNSVQKMNLEKNLQQYYTLVVSLF